MISRCKGLLWEERVEEEGCGGAYTQECVRGSRGIIFEKIRMLWKRFRIIEIRTFLGRLGFTNNHSASEILYH